MGAGHSHNTTAELTVSVRARYGLIGLLVALAVIAIAGLIYLWPTPSEVAAATSNGYDSPGVSYHQATIQTVSENCETEVTGSSTCQLASVELTDGDEAGQIVDIELLGPNAQAGLRTGDTVEVARIDTADGVIYSYSGTNRLPVLGILLMLFVVCVLAVARWKGLFALVGLGIAGFVLLGFMLPALITDRPGIPVTLAGSTVIMFVVLYVAHGVSVRTSTALAGTLLGLAVTTGLGAAAVYAARLSGFADEADYDLAQLVPGLSFQELLVCAIIIGGLGVLNDVTITQSSAVWELRAAAPHYTRLQLFNAGMRIGRDHIASTIYTIVFAYSGGALTVLLLLYFSDRGFLELFGVEMFAGEAVRTLASAIGLVLSVPITTGIAALTIGDAAVTPSPADPPA